MRLVVCLLKISTKIQELEHEKHSHLLWTWHAVFVYLVLLIVWQRICQSCQMKNWALSTLSNLSLTCALISGGPIASLGLNSWLHIIRLFQILQTSACSGPILYSRHAMMFSISGLHFIQNRMNLTNCWRNEQQIGNEITEQTTWIVLYIQALQR